MKFQIYNLIFGKSYSNQEEIILNQSPKEFKIFDFKFIRVDDFENKIKNLYKPIIEEEKFEYKSDKNFIEFYKNNPDKFDEYFSHMEKEINSKKFYIDKGKEINLHDVSNSMNAEYKISTIPENIGAHQLTYEVEISNNSENSVIYKDATLLDDILLLLSIFTGYRVILQKDLNNYWQKTNLEMLEWNYKKIIYYCEHIITKFKNNEFIYDLHGKNLFYYLELSSTYFIDLQLSILGTILDSFSLRFYNSNDSDFQCLMDKSVSWLPSGDKNSNFTNRLYYLLYKLFLQKKSLLKDLKYHTKSEQFVSLRNEIVHNCRIFPAEKINGNNFQLASDLKPNNENKYKRIFPFVNSQFNSETYHDCVLRLYELWRYLYIYFLLEIVNIDDWYFKEEFEKEILRRLS